MASVVDRISPATIVNIKLAASVRSWYEAVIATSCWSKQGVRDCQQDMQHRAHLLHLLVRQADAVDVSEHGNLLLEAARGAGDASKASACQDAGVHDRQRGITYRAILASMAARSATTRSSRPASLSSSCFTRICSACSRVAALAMLM